MEDHLVEQIHRTPSDLALILKVDPWGELGQGDNLVVIPLTERDLSPVLGLMEGHLVGQIPVMDWGQNLMQMGDQSENQHKIVTHLDQAEILMARKYHKIQQDWQEMQMVCL